MLFICLTLLIGHVVCQENQNKKGTDRTEPLFAFAAPLTDLGPVDPDPFGRMTQVQTDIRQNTETKQNTGMTINDTRSKPLTLADLLEDTADKPSDNSPFVEVKFQTGAGALGVQGTPVIPTLPSGTSAIGGQGVPVIAPFPSGAGALGDQVAPALPTQPSVSLRLDNTADLGSLRNPVDRSRDLGELKDLIDPALEAQIMEFNSGKMNSNMLGDAGNTQRSGNFQANNFQTSLGVNDQSSLLVGSDFLSVTQSPADTVTDPFLNEQVSNANFGTSAATETRTVQNPLPSVDSTNVRDPGNVFGDVNIPIDLPLFPDIEPIRQPSATELGISDLNAPLRNNVPIATPGQFPGNTFINNGIQNQATLPRGENVQLNSNSIENRGLSASTRMRSGFPPNSNFGSEFLQGGTFPTPAPPAFDTRLTPTARDGRLSSGIRGRGFLQTNNRNSPPSSSEGVRSVRRGFGGSPSQFSLFGTSFPSRTTNTRSLSTSNSIVTDPSLNTNLLRNRNRVRFQNVAASIFSPRSRSQLPQSLINQRTSSAVTTNAFPSSISRRTELDRGTIRNFVNSLDRRLSPTLSPRPFRRQPLPQSLNRALRPVTRNLLRSNLLRRPINNPSLDTNRALFARMIRPQSRPVRPQLTPRIASRTRQNAQFQAMPVDQFDTMFSNRINGRNFRRPSLLNGVLNRRQNTQRNDNVLQQSLAVLPRNRVSVPPDPTVGQQGAVQDAMALMALSDGSSNILERMGDNYPFLLLSRLNQVPLANTFMNPLANFRDGQSNTVPRGRIETQPSGILQPGLPGRNSPLPFFPFRTTLTDFTSSLLLADVNVKDISRQKLKPTSNKPTGNELLKRTQSLWLRNRNTKPKIKKDTRIKGK